MFLRMWRDYLAKKHDDTEDKILSETSHRVLGFYDPVRFVQMLEGRLCFWENVERPSLDRIVPIHFTGSEIREKIDETIRRTNNGTLLRDKWKAKTSLHKHK